MTLLRHPIGIKNRIIGIMIKLVFIYLIVLCPAFCYGQQSIHGMIVDESSGAGIPGVNIHIPYSLTGTSTSTKGDFVLIIPHNTSDILVSSIGYQSKTIKAPFDGLPMVISLAPHTTELAAISIESKVDKKWKQQFKKFRKEFIGNSKLSRKCKILNPWVVDLKRDGSSTFTGSAKEPIIIENKATGYLIHFQLDKFSKKGDVVTIAGKPYFKEQLSDDNVIKQMQLSSRESTYNGSKAHFLYALQMNLMDIEGFEIYQTTQDPTTGTFVTQRTLKRKNIYKTGQLSFPGLLKVVYTKEEDEDVALGVTTLPASGSMTGSTIEAPAYQTSYLYLRQSIVKLGANGIPIRPELLIEYGYWDRDRIAELLPSEFIPKRLIEKKTATRIVSDPLQNTSSMNGFKLSDLKIPNSEIRRGGPPRDGIPSIDRPKFISANEVEVSSDQKVLGVKFNGISKAYPISIMNWHEIVNDSFGGHPVVITYCPLCGSGIAFDAMVDNRPTTFGVSGLLFNSDVLLYDRQSESLWSQIEMKAVSGTQSGKPLKYINTTHTSWKAWVKDNPNTLLLSQETGFTRNYSQSPYSSYALSDQLMFPVNNINKDLPNKELIIGVNIDAKFKAYPLRTLKKQKGKVMDQLAGQTILIKYDVVGESATVFDLQGNLIPSIQLYWFAWYAFHPNTAIYNP